LCEQKTATLHQKANAKLLTTMTTIALEMTTKKTTGELLLKILKLGNVKFLAKTTSEGDLLDILESWLGLTAPKDDEHLMMEDAAPFGADFYKAMEEWLVSVYQPPQNSYIMTQSNALLECSVNDPKNISLYKAWDVMRITRLLKYWLELNVSGANTMMQSEERGGNREKSLSDFLLKYGVSKDSGNMVYPLIQAIYAHLAQLPWLQSHIYIYTQSLQQKNSARGTSGKALQDPQSRLLQYQETQNISSKLNTEWEEHLSALEFIVGHLYIRGNAQIRRQSRAHLGGIWSKFISRAAFGGVKMENTSSSGIDLTLRLLHRILLGTRQNLEKAHLHLLKHHLIPLHQPNSMVLWRDQISLLELYHEPLVQCIAIVLQKTPEIIPQTIAGLLEPEIWVKGGNTPKLVLLLHEIDTYIGIWGKYKVDFPSEILVALFRTLGLCMASDHSRLAERALSFFKNEAFLSLTQMHFELSLSLLLPSMVRSEPAWNPTVRKMTYRVLKTFQDFDPESFLRIGNNCCPSDTTSIPSLPPVVPRSKIEGGTIQLQSYRDTMEMPKDFTLKSAMSGWKPPTKAMSKQSRIPPATNSAMPPPSSRGLRPSAPPLTVTGVAPWTMDSNKIPSNSRRSREPPMGVTGVAPWSMNNQNRYPSTTENPPLGVTGVPPWSIQPKNPPIARMNNHKRRAREILPELVEGESKPDEANRALPPPNNKSRVLAYMESIKPPEEEDGVSSWAKDQMAETPTLLPNLKFHDLVFGHDLGEGAFGSVRYARLIDRSRTRSQWAEYAVKIISTEKIKEMGYEASVQRELAVLRIMSHPGIARLISNFRFREGVYLVLEYASGGDLHSLLRKNGSLDHASTRFVLGEIVAALSSIHDLGLVYADLKPENIVFTEEGHTKLTDFGGCRPITNESKLLIGDVAKYSLSHLRDGDWKPQSMKSEEKRKFDLDEDSEEDEKQYHPYDDLRIEGTTAYLPPEVVMGGFPTPAADAWALGCVLYQCLSGRPPIIEDNEAMTKTRIVSFDVGKAEDRNDPANLLFKDRHAVGIESNARDLITDLLNKIVFERPNMTQTAQHAFFMKEGIDAFSLYRQPAPALDVGDVSPVEDAQWSRRQFSSIWAPQPKSYEISMGTDMDIRSQNRTFLYSGPIPEGDEATAFFLASTLRHSTSDNKVPFPALKRPIQE
jgi:serine/threonine protein kinase